jgi:hypothetical protein
LTLSVIVSVVSSPVKVSWLPFTAGVTAAFAAAGAASTRPRAASGRRILGCMPH